MKWSELSARERDALVGEKVLGWIPGWSKLGYGIPPGVPSYISNAAEIPYFTTDIAAAWQTVEKLVARLYEFSFHSHKGQWLASFGSPTMEGKSAVAAEAISIAALKACGVEIEY